MHINNILCLSVCDHVVHETLEVLNGVLYSTAYAGDIVSIYAILWVGGREGSELQN